MIGALAWLTLVLVPQEADEAPAAPATPAPVEFPARETVAGMPGVDVRSRVTFHQAPDQPHELAVVLLFPQRARIELRAVGADGSARQREYVAGAHCFFVEAGAAKSVELEGPARDELRLRVALRRALLLWPDGATWTGEGAVRTTAVGEAGTLEVELDDTARPRVMRARDAEGRELEAYSGFEWYELHGRTWPRAMDFSYRGTAVWREEVLELGVRPNFLDWFFLPADRRPTAPDGFDAPGAVRNTDLPPMVVRRFPLEGERTWSELLEYAGRLVERVRARLDGTGLDVEDPVNFLLDEAGRATHCELRLATAVDEAPEGWTALPERAALTTFDRGPPGDLAAVVRRMRRSAPEGAEPGLPYVRAHPASGPAGKLQVVLPLVR